ncbi:hypothetical protein VTJ04DRAFT_6304 [Mycothermus thermophilus]|uniref:uncharacterized protein n=1 Tax=Humicola insolens TaxID=85995 RepID=UPI0037437C35
MDAASSCHNVRLRDAAWANTSCANSLPVCHTFTAPESKHLSSPSHIAQFLRYREMRTSCLSGISSDEQADDARHGWHWLWRDELMKRAGREP